MENDKYPVRRLTRDEFASALKKGLGRAWLHVDQYGLEEVVDLVLGACVHNQSYDYQCESSRATWLFSMFGHSPYYPKFSETILAKLATEKSTGDLQQLCGLAAETAAQGDKAARQQLGERVREIASTPSEDDWLGADLWVELEGVKGLLELARIYGQRLLRNPGDFVPDNISSDETKQEFKEALLRCSLNEPDIKTYWDYVQARGLWDASPGLVDRAVIRRQHHERVRQEYTLESILQDARNKVGKFPGRFAMFGRHATVDELDEICTQLLNEGDEAICLRLLWVFRRASLPRLDERLFHWAKVKDISLREAAIAALAQVKDEKVRNLALAKTKAGELLGEDNDGLDLFLSNYESGDADLIAQALISLRPEIDDAHSLGSSVLDLVERWNDVGLGSALNWVYENTPCTLCRRKAVEWLAAWQQLDDAMLHECQFDAEEDVQAFAHKQVAARQ